MACERLQSGFRARIPSSWSVRTASLNSMAALTRASPLRRASASRCTSQPSTVVSSGRELMATI
jgi:hypothetical protein